MKKIFKPTATFPGRAVGFLRRFQGFVFWLAAFTHQPMVAELGVQTPGTERWAFITTGGSVPSSPAFGDDGTVYVGSSDQ
jgi:outer membrane protein assembly factor BamB